MMRMQNYEHRHWIKNRDQATRKSMLQHSPLCFMFSAKTGIQPSANWQDWILWHARCCVLIIPTTTTPKTNVVFHSPSLSAYPPFLDSQGHINRVSSPHRRCNEYFGGANRRVNGVSTDHPLDDHFRWNIHQESSYVTLQFPVYYSIMLLPDSLSNWEYVVLLPSCTDLMGGSDFRILETKKRTGWENIRIDSFIHVKLSQGRIIFT